MKIIVSVRSVIDPNLAVAQDRAVPCLVSVLPEQCSLAFPPFPPPPSFVKVQFEVQFLHSTTILTSSNFAAV